MVDPAVDANDGMDAHASEVERKSEGHQKEGASPSAFHRTQFVSPEQKARGRYDIAVLILSGGALGLCLVVGQDYLRLRGGGGAVLLALAMLCWALSVSCILFSWKVMRPPDVEATSAPLVRSFEGIVSALSTGSTVLFLIGAIFFAAYVATEPRADAKQQPVPRAAEEITRVLSLYDTIRDVCPDCSAVEARKVLQACEGSYVVPDVLREACPHCSDKAVLQLDRRCMEKWNRSR
jgi:hypothetical protein